MATPVERAVGPDEAERLADILEELPAGAVVTLAPGVYKVNLFIDKSLHLRGGAPGVVLDGKYRAPVLQVGKRDVDLIVEQVTLRRGSGGGVGDGGNVNVHKARSVTLREVELLDGEAEANGGGAVRGVGGRVTLDRCRFAGNRGARASTILVEGALVELIDCRFEAGAAGSAAIAVIVGELRIKGCTIQHADRAAIAILGAAGPGPLVEISDTQIAGKPIEIAPGVEPVLTVVRTTSDQPFPS